MYQHAASSERHVESMCRQIRRTGRNASFPEPITHTLLFNTPNLDSSKSIETQRLSPQALNLEDFVLMNRLQGFGGGRTNKRKAALRRETLQAILGTG